MPEFDIIIFGATGYTGRYVVEELANSNKNGNKKWAVAGRNVEKLKESLEQVQIYVHEGVNILDIPIIKADVKDEASISEMCKQAKLIINCVGPYKKYGEVVVAACVKHGTHHVDLSGEVAYLETTQAKYFKSAKEKGSYIVQCCGFDCIPADFGVALLKKQFPGDLNDVEIYAQTFPGPEGRCMNSGTWISGVNSITDIVFHKNKFESMSRSVYKKELPRDSHPLSPRLPVFYSHLLQSWSCLFLGPDQRIVERSQMFDYEFHKKRPVRTKHYYVTDSLFHTIKLVLAVAYFGFLSLFAFGRYLLEQYPSFFSAGLFTHEGPSRKQVEDSSTRFLLYGRGWSEKTAEPDDIHTRPPNKKISLEITGPEAAYAFTSICIVHAALTILEEQDKMPLSGGVLTPGVAFAETSLKERLQKRGMDFLFRD